MTSWGVDKGEPAPKDRPGLKRRGLLRLGTLITAITGASAISAIDARNAQAAGGDKAGANTYVPIAEKGAPSGVAALDVNAKLATNQLPDLSGTIREGISSAASDPNGILPTTYATRVNRPLNAGDAVYGIDRTGASDTTAALQAFLDAAAAAGKDAYLPHGEYLVTQIVVPRITLRGAGLGGFGATAGDAATLIRQTTVTGGKSALIFTGTSAAGNMNENIGPFEVSDLILRCTGGTGAGHGIEFRSADDPYACIQDTAVLRNLLIRGFTKSGIKIPSGARPLRINQVNLLFNKEYGIDFDQRSPYLSQAIHFDNISGDGNLLGLIRCSNMDKNGSVLVTNLKSEKRVNGTTTGQEDALIFENCDDTPVTVAGLTHVSSVPSGATYEPPRAAIRILGAGKPCVSYSGIAVRVRATDVGGSPATVWDESADITVPTTVVAGEYGGTSGDSMWVDHANIRATALARGESTMDRREATATGSTLSSGIVRLSYFTARKTELVANLRTITGTMAAAGATLCKVGVYLVATNGDLTLVASTANDTSMWSAANTRYAKALTAPFTKKRGQRYAIGCLAVGVTTAPNVHGQSSLHAEETGEPPRLCGIISGQTDLPPAIAAGRISNSTIQVYAALTP
jgi:hypothetical protein